MFSRHSVVRLNLGQRSCAVPALTPSIHPSRSEKVCRVFFLSPPPTLECGCQEGRPPNLPRSFNSSFHFKWGGWCSSCCSASSLVQGSSGSQGWFTLHSATHICHAAGQRPPLPILPPKQGKWPLWALQHAIKYCIIKICCSPTFILLVLNICVFFFLFFFFSNLPVFTASQPGSDLASALI